MVNLHDKFSLGAPGSQPLEHEGGLEREVKVGVLEVFNHNIIVGVSLGKHSLLNNKSSLYQLLGYVVL